MGVAGRIEASLRAALSAATEAPCPPTLGAALRHAVFPGGARIRPRLCLGVAAACGDDRPEVSLAIASALEILHCASLVHDDLPAFDDAATRRGRPSVHAAFGEPIAILAGDALIVLAFELAGRTAAAAPERAGRLIAILAASCGAPGGICAGQAWECEPAVDLAAYQRAKTGALFVAAAAAGAAAAGADPAPWRRFGALLGEAYQVADDVRDVVLDAASMGKPAGQDAAHRRPSAVAALGLAGAMAHLDRLVRDSMAAVPECAGAAAIRATIASEAVRLVPKEAFSHAA